ncbi:LSU ribosomal protein L4P [Thalassoporum mexicanum PCC 7367]|uniref:50S ribosomal protein L4 n=1 Tax=Thalassoporum mexicanum TaxID=3457544 RepID=UPI00029FAB3C|nr:50S ribosomal protein L4 [Pseudanabaena sp. PCC 7367]AFY69377.1 LSU ribosomal protein L4P [Pseudanabaena sp. PCC 7367]
MPTVIDWTGNQVGEVELQLKVAKESTAADLVHRAVVRQLNNARQGNASTKTRAEVRGGGRKPWRQKGTGRARAGSSRSPLWSGGGVIFGPKPKDYNLNMNRKERRLALRTAFQSRLEDMVVVEDFIGNLPQPKTAELAKALERWGVEPGQKTLLIIDQRQEMVYLSARNMPKLKLTVADQLSVYNIVMADKIVVTAPALEKIKAVYGGDRTELAATVEEK